MINWEIVEEGFDSAKITSRGNKFLIGNGYLGIRGTPPEYRKEGLPAINLAGIYDQVGEGWREPLNAPNGLYTYLKFEGKEYRLPETTPIYHKTTLNYRHGIFTCETTYGTTKGNLTIQSERFASLSFPHLIAMRYTITTEGEGELELITGIDGDVWDINGPHYDEILFTEENHVICAEGIAHEPKYIRQGDSLVSYMDRVYVCEEITVDRPVIEHLNNEGRRYLRRLSLNLEAGTAITMYKYISIYTSKDGSESRLRAFASINEARESEFHNLLKRQVEEWEKLWNITEVTIEGDNAAMEALNYSMYHLHSIAPRHSKHLSIPARGLSGQTYKGAVFWDTEMFMLDFFLFTEPEVAKTLLNYRIETLEGAKKKARQYGYQGAFYPWESQEGGYDACSDYNVTDVFTGRQQRTYFKDKQIHISSAIVYGIIKYTDYTGSFDLIEEGGAEVILECARFYYDLLVKRVSGDRYELYDVIGPDEYHERVNNNAYTNRMAKYTIDCAIHIIETPSDNVKTDLNGRRRVICKLMEQYDLPALLQSFKAASEKLYIPQPDPNTGIIEQFDGYHKLEDISLEKLRGRILDEREYWGGANGIAAHTQIIKQADVITMLNIFSGDYSRVCLLQNWNYYEQRTEHGSSLSACMYAILACKCCMPDQAYPFFMKSATVDLTGTGKEWAGLVYIGGTHPASSGGAYMTAIHGFAGIYMDNGELKAEPKLPTHWKQLKLKLVFRNDIYQFNISRDRVEIQKLPLRELVEGSDAAPLNQTDRKDNLPFL